EGDADAHDGLRVVPADELHDDIALLGAQPGPLGSRRPAVEVGHGRAAHQDRAGRREDAALTPRADDPSDVTRGQELLGGFDEEHPARENVGPEGKPPRGEDLFDDLQASTPGTAGHGASRAVPAPWLGRLPFAEALQSATGTRPVTSVSRRIACSCSAGKAPAAANDGDTTATRSPLRALGGWIRSCAMRVRRRSTSGCPGRWPWSRRVPSTTGCGGPAPWFRCRARGRTG